MNTSHRSTWLSLEQAWDISPWTRQQLRDLATKGTLQSDVIEGTLCFEPEGFYMAMREELYLSGCLPLSEAAARFDIPRDTLLTHIGRGGLHAYSTDTDWYLEPSEVERIPKLCPHALLPTPGEPAHRSQHERWREQQEDEEEVIQPTLPFVTSSHDSTPTLPLPFSQPELDDAQTWLKFKTAVQQSEFTHSELHQALKRGDVLSKRHEQGYLLVSKQSLDAYIPPQNWVTLDVYAQSLSQKERRQILRRLESGVLHGRLMHGIWYLAPLI